MKKIIASILAIVLSAATLAGCSSTGKSGASGEADGKPLRVGVLAAMTALPIVDMVENGSAKENGLNIELISFSTGAPMNEAMAAGQLDVSFIGAAAVFAMANSGAKMISEICNDTIAIDLVARPDSKIVTEKEDKADFPTIIGAKEALRGSTVLCPAGTLSQFEVNRYLSLFDLTVDDVNFVPMEYAQAYQAFKTGQGDLLATRSPQSFTAVDDEGWVTVASLKDLKASATAQIIASDSAYKNRHEDLVKLVKLVHETNAKLNSDIDYATDLMVKWFDKNAQTIDREVAKKQLSAKPFYTPDDVKARTFGDDLTNTLVAFMITSGQLDESLKDTVTANIKSDVVEAAGLK